MQKYFFIGGLIVLAVAWLGPLSAQVHHIFYFHMIMHMLVVAVAAPLLALGVLESKFDLTTQYPDFFAPITAAVAELIIVWGWHAPKLHHFARREMSGLVIEQGMFLAVGVWVWIACLTPHKRGAGVIGLLLTSMHMTLLGALLGLAPRSLYHHVGHSHLNALEDQQIGGAIMLLVGGIIYLSGGLWQTFKMLDYRERLKKLES